MNLSSVHDDASTPLCSVPGYLASKLTFHLMSIQSITGFPFDKEGAEELVIHIKEEMRKIEEEVEPKLPPRKLKKSEEKDYTIPAKPFKKDGTLSAVMEKWLEKHGVDIVSGVQPCTLAWLDGSFHTVVGGLQLPMTKPMTLGNQDDLKEWFIEQGWEPTLWNYKKENGKPVRDKKGNLIPTSPKMQENKRLCPNLEEMQGDLIKPVVTWLSYRNRLSVLENQNDDEKGWLNDERLSKDGRLSAGSSGIAATHRQKHTKVVNVPKAEDGVLLGKEMRSLFKPFPGQVMVGFDASALENRVEAHYCYKFEGGPEYAEEILNGDPHTKNAFAFFPDKIASLGLKFSPEVKDDPRFKPFRSKAKNGKYCLSYGGSAPKLAKTLGVPENEGGPLYDAFWNANVPLKRLKDELTRFWETTGQKKWIRAIDGRKLYSRSKHSLVNLLFQSCGAILMDYAFLLLDKWLGGIKYNPIDGTPGYLYKGTWVYRVGYFHDEGQMSCDPSVADEIGQMGVRAIKKAGEYLKLRVPMDGEYKVGNSWKETH